MHCPRCGKRLFVVTFPTVEECRANWDKVDPAMRAMVEARELFLESAVRSMLRSPDQLPDLPGDDLLLVWDLDGELRHTVIRYGEHVVWKESAFYEGY
jgi:hypothetical protein